MKIYSKLILALAVVNLFACLILTICGYINYDWIYGGTKLNTFGCALTFFALWVMLVLVCIYKFLTYRCNISFHFPLWAMVVYFAFAANGAYVAFILQGPNFEGDTSFTGVKLMFYLALSLMVNFSVVLDTLNFLKSQST